MAYMIAVVGKSKQGKTTSLFPAKIKRPNGDIITIEGLVPKNTVIINPTGKPLPIKGAQTLYKIGTKISDGSRDLHVKSPSKIAKLIALIDTDPLYKDITNIVVDDAQYLQGFSFLDKIMDEGWNKFNVTGEAGYLPLKATMDCTRIDLSIIFIYHSEKDDDGDLKIKTAGKLIDAYLTIEGVFPVVLFTKTVFDAVKGTQYYFTTQTDGKNTAGTPPGMFDDFLIPNDMGYVIKKVKEYYQ